LLLFERISEGRLFDYICRKQQFVESEAACFIHQLLDAVQYLHSCCIAHLDIKVHISSNVSLHDINTRNWTWMMCQSS